MLFKTLIVILVLIGGLFVSYRFGLFDKVGEIPSITEIKPGKQLVTPSSRETSDDQQESSYSVKILEAPTSTGSAQKLKITWEVNGPKYATTSHTAIHFGPVSQTNPSYSGDYPDKSEIFTATVPASFSAELSIIETGIYYYRALAIINSIRIWSAEKYFRIFEASPTATITP